MIFSALKKPWQRWFNSWLKQRIPRQKIHRLQHRNIFILPSKTGLVFLIVVLLLWLLGTNYQNNLVLATAFLLLALAVVCIHHTYASLSGLQLQVIKTHPGFAGSEGHVDLIIKRSGNRQYESVTLSWPDTQPLRFSLINDNQLNLSLPVYLRHRGWFQPERLKVSTDYPLGLIYAWSYLDLDASILSYPEPLETSIEPTAQVLEESDDINSTTVEGNEEFAGLRDYHDGDALRRIDWRALARGQGLATRLYEDYASQYDWLDWDQFSGMEREARLSRLCACVLKQEVSANTNTIRYGLRLPNQIIQPGIGEKHKQTVLEALALFEWEALKPDSIKREPITKETRKKEARKKETRGAK